MRKTTKGKGLAGRTAVGGRGGRAGFAPESWAGCGVWGAASPPLPCWLWPEWRLS